MYKKKSKVSKYNITIPLASKETVSHTSHELKSHITSAKAYVQLLERHLKKTTSDGKALQYLVKMDIQLSRLTNQISDFFDVLKIQKKDYELFPEKIPLEELLTSAVNTTEKIFLINAIKIYPIPDVYVFVDKLKMERAIVHVLSNAAKYSLEKENIAITTRKKGKTIEISIINKGESLTKQDEKNIFLPFFQSPKLGNQQGIGLGLYIAKQIIILHNGNIFLDISQKGRTIFTISLPIK